jgi:hypothetical protein
MIELKIWHYCSFVSNIQDRWWSSHKEAKSWSQGVKKGYSGHDLCCFQVKKFLL